MPKPVYVMCAHDIVQDKETNRMSIFNVVEKMVVKQFAKPVSVGQMEPGMLPPGLGLLKAVAVWMKEPSDAGEFEHEFVITSDGVETSVGSQPFVFADDPKKLLHRFFLEFQGGLPVPAESGTLIIRSRVRHSAATDCISQDYLIPVEVLLKTEESEIATHQEAVSSV